MIRDVRNKQRKCDEKQNRGDRMREKDWKRRGRMITLQKPEDTVRRFGWSIISIGADPLDAVVFFRRAE